MAWQTRSDPYARQQSQGFRPRPCGIICPLLAIRDWYQVGMQIFTELQADLIHQLRNPSPWLLLTCGMSSCLPDLQSPTLEKVKTYLWAKVIAPGLNQMVKEWSRILAPEFLTPILTDLVTSPLTGVVFGINYLSQGLSSLFQGQGWQVNVGQAWADTHTMTTPGRDFARKVITEIGPVKLIAGTALIGAALLTGGAALPVILGGVALGTGLSYGSQVFSNINQGQNIGELSTWTNINGWDMARAGFNGAILFSIGTLASPFLGPISKAVSVTPLRRALFSAYLGGTLNAAVGYFTTDNDKYSLKQTATDFSIGALFGAAAYGVSATFTPEFAGLNSRFEPLFMGSRILGLATLNFAETEFTKVSRGEAFTSEDLTWAFGTGLISAGVAEAITIGVGKVAEKHIVIEDEYAKSLRNFRWKKYKEAQSLIKETEEINSGYLKRWPDSKYISDVAEHYRSVFRQVAETQVNQVPELFPRHAVEAWRAYAFTAATTLGDPEFLGFAPPQLPQSILELFSLGHETLIPEGQYVRKGE